MKTGKITFITPKGKGSPFIDNETGEEVVLDNYTIGFADGKQWKFKARGEWKYPVGSEIEFEVSNEKYGTARKAKLIKEFQPTQSNPIVRETLTAKGTGYSTNDSILLQVCYKENMAAFAKDYKEEVIEYTKQDFLELKQFLNTL